MEECLHDPGDLEARLPGETKKDVDAAPMMHSRDMLPDPVETLKFLIEAAGLDPASSLAELKRECARSATATERSQDAGLRHNKKRAREDHDERGCRPEAWVRIKKVTRRKPHSLENMPHNGKLILGNREYLSLVFW